MICWLAEWAQGVLDAATGWLVGAAVALALVLFTAWLRRTRPFAPALAKFRRLQPLGKVAAICVFCALVWRGGAKNGGDRGEHNPVNPVNPVKNNHRASTNFPLSVTAILPDNSNRVVNVGLAWTSNAFDCADSRYIQSVMSTNLLVRRWLPGGEYLAPAGTNACEIAISSNSVPAVSRDAFSAACGSALFFAFGLDADADSDGLIDLYEALVTLTDPGEPDTDGDGFCDGWEAAHAGLGYDPHVYNAANSLSAWDDIDNDGLANIHEQMLGTDPTLPDTDGDGILDGVEVPVAALQAQFGQLMALYQNPPRSYPATAWFVLPVLDGCTNPLSSNNAAFATTAFYFGDPSPSHSEKYALRIGPVAGSGTGDAPEPVVLLNPLYGVCDAFVAFLPKGWSYAATFEHVSTDSAHEGNPDPDYGLLGAAGSARVVFEDPDALFGISDVTNGVFEGEGKTASLAVYGVMGVTICNPDDVNWTVLDESRVVLDNELLRVRIEISPQMPSLAACCAMFGNSLTLKTSGTNPSGAYVPLSSGTVFENADGKTVLKIALTRSQLKSYGLLPSNDSDCVDEMAWMDIVQTPGQSYADSEAFSALGYEFRGKATSDASQTLESTPPNSPPSESFFKAAGCEIVTAEYGGVASAKRQIMNQADYFYFSGHGDHLLNTVQGSYSPIAAAYYWGRDLDCAIIAGCSVLDINDYNGNYYYDQHSLSPGLAWEATGPGVLLGYNYKAPGDAGGAPARIMQSWLANRAAMGDVNAWMKANADNKAWNACAIVKDQKYVYFKRKWLGHVVEEKQKGEW